MPSSLTTILRRPGTDAGASESSFGLPADLAERACRRLSQFALMMVAVNVLVMLLSRPVWQDHADEHQLLIVRVMQLLAVGLSIALFFVARWRRLSRSTVLTLGLAYEVAFCFCVSLGYNWFTGSTYGIFASMTIATVVIAIYPMIIPCPPIRTLLAGLAAASSAPIAIFIIASAGVAQASGPDYLGVSIYPLVCVGFAVFGSRIIHGLNVDVAEAQRIGSYRLQSLLGKGGMGEVWRAEHSLLARPAAIKLINPDAVAGDSREDQDRLLLRFEREAQVTASLQSPHTVQLFDFGRTDDGYFYYVMELLEGIDLQRLVEEHGALSPARVVGILLQACHSLGEAHERGLVHRDIKPANMYLCRYGRDFDFLKVLDFGLVALGPEKQTDVRLTADDVVGGTPAYMPPELAQGSEVDGRADIYALGCVAYWLLTGRLVFEGEAPMKIVLAHVRETPVPPSQASESNIPECLDRIVLSCLCKKAADRPQTTDALADMLRACDVDDAWRAADAARWWEDQGSGTASATDG